MADGISAVKVGADTWDLAAERGGTTATRTAVTAGQLHQEREELEARLAVLRAELQERVVLADRAGHTAKQAEIATAEAQLADLLAWAGIVDSYGGAA